MRRSSRIASANTSSATERVFEYGALNTGVPWDIALSRSTWFVPMQKHPTARRSGRSEEHTSELQSLLRISYAVLCLKKNNTKPTTLHTPDRANSHHIQTNTSYK